MHKALLLGFTIEFWVQIEALFLRRFVLLHRNAMHVGPAILAGAPYARVARAYLFVRITSCCS
jgi:hypothetical protein